jgi:hypothetical protein
MSSSLKTLIHTLGSAGKAPWMYECPDGSRVLALPHGGRVLGLFTAGSDENFYWTHPALESAASAAAFYASEAWHNSGGDRTWLAPEVDVFLPAFPDTAGYFQPRQLDPGRYEAVETGGRFRLVNRLTVTLSRTGEAVELEMAKSLAPAPDPLRYERAVDLSGVTYAGYSQHTSLELLSGSGPVGLWNLVQMPLGGDLIVPTYTPSHPKIIFGNIAPEDLSASGRMIRFRMHAPGEHKIGIRAVATAGRVGYLHDCGGGIWSLIVRNFAVNPSGEYIDAPWDDTADLGYSTQACSVNSGLGQFAELEYHIPAIGGATGRSRCEDTCQVWAYRGSRERVLAAAGALLAPVTDL